MARGDRVYANEEYGAEPARPGARGRALRCGVAALLAAALLAAGCNINSLIASIATLGISNLILVIDGWISDGSGAGVLLTIVDNSGALVQGSQLSAPVCIRLTANGKVIASAQTNPDGSYSLGVPQAYFDTRDAFRYEVFPCDRPGSALGIVFPPGTFDPRSPPHLDVVEARAPCTGLIVNITGGTISGSMVAQVGQNAVTGETVTIVSHRYADGTVAFDTDGNGITDPSDAGTFIICGQTVTIPALTVDQAMAQNQPGPIPATPNARTVDPQSAIQAIAVRLDPPYRIRPTPGGTVAPFDVIVSFTPSATGYPIGASFTLEALGGGRFSNGSPVLSERLLFTDPRVTIALDGALSFKEKLTVPDDVLGEVGVLASAERPGVPPAGGALAVSGRASVSTNPDIVDSIELLGPATFVAGLVNQQGFTITLTAVLKPPPGSTGHVPQRTVTFSSLNSGGRGTFDPHSPTPVLSKDVLSGPDPSNPQQQIATVQWLAAGLNPGEVTAFHAVTSEGGRSVDSGALAVEASSSAPPRIDAVVPIQLNVGATLTLAGAGFASNAADDLVSFSGGVTAVPSAAAPGSLTVTVPPGALSGPISVVVSGALRSNDDALLTIVPRVSRFSALNITPGAIVDIFGDGFSQDPADDVVLLGTGGGLSLRAPIVSASKNRLSIVIPPGFPPGALLGATVSTLSVTGAPGGAATVVDAPPALFAVSPGDGGTGVDVDAPIVISFITPVVETSVAAALVVDMQDAPGSPTFTPVPGALVALDPQPCARYRFVPSTGLATARRVRIHLAPTVRDLAGRTIGTSFDESFLTSGGIPPVVNATSIASSNVGATVTIFGSGMSPTATANMVYFQGAPPVTPISASPGQLVVAVPAGALTGPITVESQVGDLFLAGMTAFDFHVLPRIDALSQASGPAGTRLAITGSGFRAGLVHVYFGGNLDPSVEVDSANQITATVPSGTASGPVSVVLTSGGDPSNDGVTFTVTPAGTADTTRPQVIATSPASGATGVNVSVVAEVHFSEPVTPTSVNASTFYASAGSMGAIVRASDTVYRLPLSGLPSGTTVGVSVTSGIQDPEGNALVPYQWTFTTMGAPGVTGGPGVTSFSSPGATGVEPGFSMSVLFDDALDPASISAQSIVVRRASDSLAWSVSRTLSSDGRTLTIAPAAPYSFGSAFTLSIPAGPGSVRDIFQQPLRAASETTFTIRAAPGVTISQVRASRSAATVGQPLTVTLALANQDSEPVTIQGPGLAFALGGADRTADYTIGAIQPVSIPANGAANIDVPVTVKSSARTGTAAITAQPAALDGPSGLPVPVGASPSAPLAVESAPAVALQLVNVPAHVTAGQSVALSITAGNAAGAAPADVSIAVAGPLGTASVAPATATVNGGSSQTLTVQVTAGSSIGPETLAASASVVDGNTGAKTQASASRGWTIDARPQLQPSSFSPPATVTTGRTRTFTVIVGNASATAATATGVSLGIAGSLGSSFAVAPASATIPPGQKAVFSVTATAFLFASPSELPETLTATANGFDANTHAALPPASVTTTWRIETPASLAVTVAPSQGAVSTGQQSVPVTVTIDNSGGASASLSSLTLSGASGSTFAAVGGIAFPVTIGSGKTRFDWTSSSLGSPGAEVLTASVAGTEPNTGDPKSASGNASWTIQRAASLVASSALPSASDVPVNGAFTVAVVIDNTGEAAATVTAGLSITGGGASAALGAAPAAQTIAGKSSASFVFPAQATGVHGTVSFAGSVASAIDVNTGGAAQMSGAPATSVNVDSAPQVTLLLPGFPAAVTQGEVLTLTLTATNASGSAAANVAPAFQSTRGTAFASLSPKSAVVSPGATQTFTVQATVSRSSTGSDPISVNATITNQVTGAVTSTGLNPVWTIYSRPALAISSFTPGTSITTGRSRTFSVPVTNTLATASTATGVSLAASGSLGSSFAVSPASASIPPGQQLVFTVTVTAVTFASPSEQVETITATADGLDAITLQPLAQASIAPATWKVQTPASLVASVAPSQTTVSTGQQNVPVTVTIKNTGGASVTLSSITLSGARGSTFNPVAGLPATLAGSSSAPFRTTSASLGSAGVESLTARVAATEQNSGESRSPQPGSGSWTIQTAASLIATAVRPAASEVAPSGAFTVDVVIQNAGEASATVTADLAVTGGPASITGRPAAAVVAGSSSQTFRFQLQAGSTTGTVGLTGSVKSALDTNTGQAATITVGPTGNPTASVKVESAPQIALAFVSFPATVTEGEVVTLKVQATNGSAGAATATVSLGFQSSLGTAFGSVSPSSAAIGAGASQTFTVQATAPASSVGSDAIGASASVTSPVTTGSSTFTSSGTWVVEKRPVLSIATTASSFAPPSSVTTAHSGSFNVVVKNADPSAATATGVSLALKGSLGSSFSVSPSSASIAPAQQASFSVQWTVASFAGAPLVRDETLTASANGTDANTGAALAQATATRHWSVATPASLVVTVTAPGTVNTGQTSVPVTVTVENQGGASASISAMELSGANGSKFGAFAGPALPATVGGSGGTATFTTTSSSLGAPGSELLTSHVTATEPESGDNKSTIGTATWTIQTAASADLSSLSPSAPGVAFGTSFTVTLTVTNTGQADADVGTSLAITGGSGSASQTSSPSPAVVTIAGGGSHDFVYGFRSTSTSGTVELRGAIASAVDHRTGAAVATSGSPKTTSVKVGPNSIAYSSGDRQSAAAGKAFAAPLAVSVTDVNGAPVKGATVDFSVTSGGATLGATSATTDSQGSAAMTLTAGTATASVTVEASGSGLAGSPVSFTETIVAGAPARLAFTVQPTDLTVGEYMAPPVEVEVEDTYGNVVSVADSIKLSFGQNPSGAALGGASITSSAGVAAFPNLTLDRPGQGFTLVATDPARSLTSAASSPFNAVRLTVTSFGGDRPRIQIAGPANPALAQASLRWTLAGYGDVDLHSPAGVKAEPHGTLADSATPFPNVPVDPDPRASLKVVAFNRGSASPFDESADLALALSRGGAGTTQGTGIAAVSDGGAIICGNFSGVVDFGAFASGTHVSLDAANGAMFFARYEKDGTLVFAKQAGSTSGGQTASVNGIAAFPDGSFALSGYSTGMSMGAVTFGRNEPTDPANGRAGPTSPYYPQGGGQDIFVARFNADGSLRWVSPAGGSGDDAANGVAALIDGSVAVTGSFSSNPAIFGRFNLSPQGTGGTDMFVARYAPDGTCVTAASAGNPSTGGRAQGNAVAGLPDGGVAVTGYFVDHMLFPGTNVSLGAAGGATDRDIFVARYRADGSIPAGWQPVSAGGPSPDEGLAIAVRPDGATVVTGFFTGTARFPGVTNQLNAAGGTTDEDVFVAAFDASGSSSSLNWAVSAGGGNSDRGYAVAAFADDTVAVTGYYSSVTATFGSRQLRYLGNDDVFVARYARDGSDVFWAKRAGGGAGVNTDIGTAISALPDGSVLLTGSMTGTGNQLGPDEDFPPPLLDAHSGGTDVFLACFEGQNYRMLEVRPAGIATARKEGGAGNNVGYGAGVFPDGSSIVTGMFSGTAFSGYTGGPVTASFPSTGPIFVARYYPSGAPDRVIMNGGYRSAGEGRAAAALADGSAVIAGWFTGGPTFGSLTPLRYTDLNQFFLVKVDAALTPKWEAQGVQQVGGSTPNLYTEALAVAAFPDGSSIVTGYFGGTIDIQAKAQLTSVNDASQNPSRDMFVARFNANGSMQWALSAGGPGEDEGLGVAALPDGSAIVTGYFNGTATFRTTVVGAPQPTLSASSQSAFMVRYDASGNITALVQGGVRPGGASPSTCQGNGVAAFADSGDAVVVGAFSGDATFGYQEKNEKLLHASSGGVFTARLDRGLNLRWVTQGGSGPGDEGTGAAALPDGRALVTGKVGGSASFSGTRLPQASGLFFAAYDAGGGLSFVRPASADASTHAFGIAAHPDGSSVLTGAFDQVTLGQGLPGGPGDDPNVTTLQVTGPTDLFVARYYPY